jgi:glutamine amidotransferase
MLRYRMWLVLVCYAVISAGLATLVRMLGVSGVIVGVIGLLISLLVGLEAGTLRRFTLSRRGWKNLGVVSGDDLEDAERRFFDAWLQRTNSTAGGPRAPAAGPASAASIWRGPSGSEVTGLFPEPGARRNLHSAAKAFERAAHEAGLGQPIVVTNDPAVVAKADRVVLPGVGAFADCRRGLDAVNGMVGALDEAVRQRGRPFFGICVGMQLLAERGREYEVTEGLGWIAGEVDRIVPRDPNLKIPHMGWNTLNVARPHPVLDGLTFGPQGRHAYFVHSYQLNPAQRADLVADAEYGGAVTAIVARDNIFGTQFHPEKSQKLGLALIANFLQWNP